MYSLMYPLTPSYLSVKEHDTQSGLDYAEHGCLSHHVSFNLASDKDFLVA
jgi:hypothetical protein